MKMKWLQIERIREMMMKELIKMWRDNINLEMMMIVKIMKLIMLGFEIKNDKKRMKREIVEMRNDNYKREMIQEMEKKKY